MLFGAVSKGIAVLPHSSEQDNDAIPCTSATKSTASTNQSETDVNIEKAAALAGVPGVGPQHI